MRQQQHGHDGERYGGDEPASNDAGATVTINVGYENATTEPAAQAAEKWKELVEEKSGGSIQLELFPNSTLGKKNDLIDQMLMGESVITVADGAFSQITACRISVSSMRRIHLRAGMNCGLCWTATGMLTCATSWQAPAACVF